MIHVLAFLAIVWICWERPRVAALAGALFMLWLPSNPEPSIELTIYYLVAVALFAFAFYPRRKRV